jgi:hypothetical protein
MTLENDTPEYEEIIEENKNEYGLNIDEEDFPEDEGELKELNF